MSNRSVEKCVRKWLVLLDRKKVDPALLLQNARNVSLEMNELIDNAQCNESELRRALVQAYDWTRFRMLRDLQKIDEHLLQLAVEHVRAGHKGMSLSHLLYATKIRNGRIRTSLLRASMKERLGVRRFQRRVNAKKEKSLVGGKEVRRPSNVIKQLNRVANELTGLFATISDPNFQGSIRAMDDLRRQNGDLLLHSTIETLKSIGTEIPRSVAKLQTALAVLKNER